MSYSLTSTMPGATADYGKYLYDVVKRTDRFNDSTLLDFTLAPYDSSFVPLNRGAYIVFNTDTYPNWFTGYVTAEPERIRLGTNSAGVPIWGYKIEATSDEYILSLSSVGVQPAFMGVTMGTVIKTLANQLCPGVFDTSNVQDGLTLASYTVTPDQRFSDIVKDFTSSANYVFWATNHKLFFQQQNYVNSPLVIDGSSRDFTPSNLQIRPALNQIINDAVVIGDIAPEAYVTEYIVGNGFDASFPLLTSVYGADAYVMINEQFSGSSIDSQTWTVYDNATNYLQLFNGYLNVLGGSNNNSFDVSVQSVYPVQLEGSIRLTHGEFDFLPENFTNTVDGIVGGLWTGQPTASRSYCLYGIQAVHNNDGTFIIQPTVHGVPDGTQWVTPDTSGRKRYVLRTIANFNRQHRQGQAVNYRDATGTVNTVGGQVQSDTAYFITTISEIDVVTGLLTNSWKWENDGIAIQSSQLYATYMPVVSNCLHCTLSGITVSYALQATLDKAVNVQLPNLDFSSWTDANNPSNWDFLNSVQQDVSDDPAQSCCKLVSTNPVGGTFTAYAERFIGASLIPGVTYKVSCRVLRSSNFTGSLTLDLNDPVGNLWSGGNIYPGVQIAAGQMSSASWNTFSGTLTTSITLPGGMASIPSTIVLRVYITSNTNTPIGSWVAVEDVVIYRDWDSVIIGPNDLDSLDGQVTVATISSTSNLPQTTTYTGVPVYNPGASTLVFFKDTALQTATTPQPTELYRLTYRAAGNCYGRAQSKDSIALEAALWGDGGVRSISKSDCSPRPRNTDEAEAAAAALVGQDSYQHYDGSYTVISDYSNGQPRAGSILRFYNLPAGLPPVVAEEINQVETTFISSRPKERFQHVVTFGEPDYARRVLASFQDDKGSFAAYIAQQQTTNQIVDITNIGLAFAPDVVEPVLYAWDGSNFYIDCNQAPPSGGGFEIRSTDACWGCEDGRNLVTRLTGGATLFSILRQDKTRAVFIKAYDIRNHVLYSEDQSKSNYFLGSATCSMQRLPNPDNRYSQICVSSMQNNGVVEAATADNVTSGQQLAGSVSIKPSSAAWGKQFLLQLVVSVSGTEHIVASKSITLGNGWQRYTVAGTAGYTGTALLKVYNQSGSTQSVSLTRFSIEYGTLVETAYCKTVASTYGATSRFPAVMRLAFPPSGPVGAFVDSSLEVDTLNTSVFIAPPSQTVTVDGNSVIVPNALIKTIQSAGDVTLSLAPVINGGTNGQYLTLMNVGAYNITLQCSSSNPSSTLATSTDQTIGSNRILNLVYFSNQGWILSSAAIVPSETRVNKDYKVASTDQNIMVDTSAGDVTITLAAGTQLIGQFLTVQKVTGDSNKVHVVASVGDFVGGASSTDLTSDGQSITLLASTN